MVTDYQALLCEGTEALRAFSDTPRLDAEVLLSFLMGKERVWFAVHAKESAANDVCAAFRSLILRRKKGEPIAYITGTREFMGLSFSVQPGVLIPRPDTETLVEAVLKSSFADRPRILDLCTGSGAVAVSLAHFLPQALVCAVDCSALCVETAQKNALANGVGSRVHCLQRDILSAGFCLPLSVFSVPAENGDFESGDLFLADILTANPPYIRSADMETLMKDVKDFEPHLALDGGKDGLLFYRRIAELAPSLLVSGGLLALEVGHDQADAVSEILNRSGHFASIRFCRDLAGIRRVVLAQTD